MKNIEQKVNLILVKWNPIGVLPNVAMEEYTAYIPLILSKMHSKTDLLKYLEEILLKDMQVDYDSRDCVQKADLENICKKIRSIGGYMTNKEI
jgi:hypothetical protein